MCLLELDEVVELVLPQLGHGGCDLCARDEVAAEDLHLLLAAEQADKHRNVRNHLSTGRRAWHMVQGHARDLRLVTCD